MTIEKFFTGTISKSEMISKNVEMKENFYVYSSNYSIVNLITENYGWNYVDGILKKYRGRIEYLISKQYFIFDSKSDAQDFLESDEILPVVMMMRLMGDE